MTDPQSQLRQFLLASRNPDGGWAYAPGKATRLEPTSWALIALPDVDPGVLRRWPLTGDLLRERADGDANFGFHAVGLLALVARGIEHEAGNTRLIKGLEDVRGVALSNSEIYRQDNSLQGWSWIPQTFSWVEPTGWALLALKKWSRVSGGAIDADRVAVAEKLLVDRACAQGGWNYGNSNMKNLFARFVREEDGQDIIEYSLLAAFISISGYLILTSIGTQVNTIYTNVNGVTSQAATASAGGGS